MASFHNVDGKDVKIETPIIANVLPIVAFGVTAGLIYGKTKSVVKALGFGALAAGVGFIPRLVLIKKGMDDAKSLATKSKSAQSTTPNSSASQPEQTTSSAETSHDDGSETNVSPEDILSIIEKIANKNGKQTIFATKKNYFLKLLKNFSRKQRRAAYDTVVLVEQMPKNPSETDVDNTLESISMLEDKYGKDFLDNINKRLKHISDEISIDAKKNADKKTPAA